jgi:ribulose-phosphate 3-epimerase
VLCIPQGSLVSFHIESSSDFFLTIKKIIEKKCLAGIAINPKTALHEIIPLINNLDHIVIMSVNPGFSGQPFLEEVIPKIDELIAYKYMHGYTFKIGIDGGVNASIISLLAHKDIDYYAISSAIFQQADPYAELKRLTALVRGSKR